jgi:hypothetical protein
VGTVGGLDNPGKLCSDTNGDVWVTTGTGSGPGTLVEYAHGGKTPIQMLNDPSAPQDCSVDPTTGNLAVANGCYSGSCESNLAVYAHATGTPTLYKVPYGPAYSCTYDNAGNAFIAAFEDTYKTGTLWLRAGGSTVSRFLLVPRPYPHVGVQWDGRRLALEISLNEIYEYSLRLHSGHRSGTTRLQGGVAPFWIQGSIIIGASGGGIVLWPYPGGGKPIKTLHLPSSSRVYGLTVSVAKSY